jgi:hypothetical protein
MFSANVFYLFFCFSIQNMKRANGRFIRARYELRALETSTVPFPFDIMKDPRWVFP